MAEAGARSAKELGAEKDAQAALYLKYANDAIAEATNLMKVDQNLRADQILQRAGADAELSVSLAKEAAVKDETNQAKEKLKLIKGGK